MEKKYWKGVEELRNDAEFVKLKNNEFFEHLPVDEVIGKKAESTESTSRRDFLKLMGFGMAAATLAACETPVKKSIPYLVKPEEIVPGVPNYYASTYYDGHDYASVLVKTREGRPIKVDGNDLSPLSKGASHARVQASVLSLYDTARLKGPQKKGADITWENANTEIIAALNTAVQNNGKIRVLTSTIISPSTASLLSAFAAKYQGTQVVTYDAISMSGTINANKKSFGQALLPTYRFDKANVVVAFDCDFLANWYNNIENARQYAMNRKLTTGNKMSRHYQFEGTLSVTGSNADHRYRMRPSQHGVAVVSLYNQIASLAGAASAGTSAKTGVDNGLSKAAAELWNNRGASLVVSGSNDEHVQMMVNAINQLLGNYGNTIMTSRSSRIRQGDDAMVEGLLKEMEEGTVEVLIMNNTNPVYTHPQGDRFKKALANVKTVISFAGTMDESAAVAGYVCPDHHYLEAWNDAEPVSGMYSLAQPTITNLYNSRQMQDSLIKWAGVAVADYYTYLKNFWSTNLYPRQTGITSTDAFWNQTLQNGVFEVATKANEGTPVIDLTAASAIVAGPEGIDVVIYEKTGMGTGNQANNPWLQEMPDPISKITWDNYVCVPPSMANELGLKQGNVVQLSVGGKSIRGPVCVQPGVAANTVAVAVGYGRTNAGKTADNRGFNAYALAPVVNGSIQYFASGANLSKTTEDYPLAATQTHHTMMGRAIVKETNLDQYTNDPKSGNPDLKLETHKGKLSPAEVDLWATGKHPGHDKPNHFWGMSIDLNACIGCGSCVIACQAENNVPVVGKDEVMRAREMHWIRIDRYYSSDTTKQSAKEEDLGKLDMLHQMEVPSDDPEVVFQPIMCQHCNHAPCETVCPVVATTHSEEGLNMMAYNRCVGTRYCANNCPYKVRRYNWFKYFDNPQFDFNMNDDTGKMVLNPDVIVRSRGVMEKCSMCVQRIQHGKLEAKKAGRRPKDGEIITACAQSCPTNAITFGDYNDPDSRLSAENKSPRSYSVLEELNVQPSVKYLTKVRNKDAGANA